MALSLDKILELPPFNWKIASLLTTEGILVLGGPPKLGKSRALLSLLLEGAQNRPAFGRFQQDYGRVLVYNAEGGVQGMRMRASMFGHLGVEVLSQIDITSDRPLLTFANGQPNPAVFEELYYKWQHYDVIVLDPLVSFHCASENDNQQMGALMDALRRLCEEAATALIIVHHTGKLDANTTIADAKGAGGKKLRGASAIHGAADNIAIAWPWNRGLSLVFDLRYAPPEPEARLWEDKRTGRFWRDAFGAPALADWLTENPPSKELFQEAFLLDPSTVKTLFQKEALNASA